MFGQMVTHAHQNHKTWLTSRAYSFNSPKQFFTWDHHCRHCFMILCSLSEQLVTIVSTSISLVSNSNSTHPHNLLWYAWLQDWKIPVNSKFRDWNRIQTNFAMWLARLFFAAGSGKPSSERYFMDKPLVTEACSDASDTASLVVDKGCLLLHLLWCQW